MASQPFVAKIIGVPSVASITEVNVRSGPGTNKDIAFKAAVGTGNLAVLEVQHDNESRDQQGKVYQWFKLQFPNAQGWVRDDLIEIVGDGYPFGYPPLAQPTMAFLLTREAVTQITPAGQTAGSTPTAAPGGFQATAAARVTNEHPAVEVPAHVAFTPDEQPDSSTETPIATCMNAPSATLRAGAGTNYGQVDSFLYQDTATILKAAPGEDGKDFMWIKIHYKGKEAWVREDLVRLSGGFGPFGVSAEDAYPSPAPQSRWSRDFDSNGSRIGVKHDGWDHSGDTGAPIIGGPKGGYVVQVAFCQRCGTQGASTLERGYTLGDQRVFNDQGWNFGYGHYVVVRYTHDLLPASTQQALSEKGMAGAHIFVMYAHLHQMLVETGQTLQPNQQIGTMGNSGNSTGTHLHLEVRAHADADETAWWKMKAGLMTPQVLFLR